MLSLLHCEFFAFLLKIRCSEKCGLHLSLQFNLIGQCVCFYENHVVFITIDLQFNLNSRMVIDTSSTSFIIHDVLVVCMCVSLVVIGLHKFTGSGIIRRCGFVEGSVSLSPMPKLCPVSSCCLQNKMQDSQLSLQHMSACIPPTRMRMASTSELINHAN